LPGLFLFPFNHSFVLRSVLDLFLRASNIFGSPYVLLSELSQNVGRREVVARVPLRSARPVPIIDKVPPRYSGFTLFMIFSYETARRSCLFHGVSSLPLSICLYPSEALKHFYLFFPFPARFPVQLRWGILTSFFFFARVPDSCFFLCLPVL